MSATSPRSKDRPRLGRGLSSLIATTEPIVSAEIPQRPPASDMSDSPVSHVADGGRHAVVDVPLSAIEPNPHQPRGDFDEHSLAELAASIKTTGLIQPVIARRVDGRYQLIAGERRLRAARMAGLETVPAIIRDVDSYTQAQMALVENIQRQDLNPMDRAAAYRTLINQLGLTQAELAGRLGEDRSSVTNHVRLLDLPIEVQAMVREGRVSLGHAKLLAGVSDTAQQQRLAGLITSQDLSVRNLERLVESARIGQEAPVPVRQPAPNAAHMADLEKSISRQLGMRVQVRSSGKGRGRLVVHYASLDQFDDLIGRLGISVE